MKNDKASFRNRIIPGFSAELNDNKIKKAKHVEKLKNNISDDTQNRDKVFIKMQKLISYGESIENAAKMVAGDEESINDFKYLIDNEIKLEELFKGIYKGRTRKGNRVFGNNPNRENER